MNTPNHIALILDGNRRWATEHHLPKMMGHTEGAKNIKTIALASIEQHIRYLTLFVLSTENLKNRSEMELTHLYSLFAKIIDYGNEMNTHNVRMHVIGDLSKMPRAVQESMTQAIKKTEHNTGLTLTFAVNYGGRDEMMRAIKKMLADGIKPDDMTEEAITQYLDTKNMPDVDIMIRTGGDQRISNYLPWQSVYAELYFTPIYWPSFTKEDLINAIEWFRGQKRNKGK